MTTQLHEHLLTGGTVAKSFFLRSIPCRNRQYLSRGAIPGDTLAEAA